MWCAAATFGLTALGVAPASAQRLVDRPAERAQAPRAAAARALTRPTWLTGVTVTEYYSAPESRFRGKKVRAPGIPGVHRIDWLYSALGVTMEGDGIGLDGKHYHVDSVGRGGWVDRQGRRQTIGGGGGIYWRAGGYYRNASGAVTFPLDGGGWSAGAGLGYVPLPGVSFAPGSSIPLVFYKTLAVDRSLIPRGSRVYIPYYKGLGGGWFVAQDTGGAITGRHVDVYRPPPRNGEGARYLSRQRIYVIPPGPGRPPVSAPSSMPAPAPSTTYGSTGGTSS